MAEHLCSNSGLIAIRVRRESACYDGLGGKEVEKGGERGRGRGRGRGRWMKNERENRGSAHPLDVYKGKLWLLLEFVKRALVDGR